MKIIDAQPMRSEPEAPGVWLHPAFPWDDVPDETSAEPYLRAWGFECEAVTLEADRSLQASTISERMFVSDEESNWCDWVPTPPTGMGWFIVSMHDTEAGPAALFARSLDPAIQERHWWMLVLQEKARLLAIQARQHGVVLTISQGSVQPPAMGRHVDVVDVREVRR